MIAPSSSINGTSKDELLEQLIRVCDALRAARHKMHEAAPNGRDYLKPGSFQLAQDEHVARLRRIEDLLREYEQLAEAVSG